MDKVARLNWVYRTAVERCYVDAVRSNGSMARRRPAGVDGIVPSRPSVAIPAQAAQTSSAQPEEIARTSVMHLAVQHNEDAFIRTR